MSVTTTIQRNEFSPYWQVRRLTGIDLAADVPLTTTGNATGAFARKVIVEGAGLGSLVVVHADDTRLAYHGLTDGDIVEPDLSLFRTIDADFAITAASGALQEDATGGPSYVTETTDFNSATASDTDPYPTGAGEAAGDRFLIGFTEPWNELVTTLGTVGIGGTSKLVYYTGSTSLISTYDATAWTDLATVRESVAGVVNLTASGTARWKVPANWLPATINSLGPFYWMGFECLTVYSTNPTISQGVLHQATTIDRCRVGW